MSARWAMVSLHEPEFCMAHAARRAMRVPESSGATPVRRTTSEHLGLACNFTSTRTLPHCAVKRYLSLGHYLRWLELYQGTGPSRLMNVPVGPSLPIVAIFTMASVPSVTVWVPLCELRSVAVKPGSTELMRMLGSAFAYWVVSMLSAALEEE
jgi:hypothetical protein